MAHSPRRIAVLGSTGSIGTQALQVTALHPDQFQITALTARSDKEKLFKQVRAFHPQMAGLAQPIPLADIPEDLRFCHWVFGEDALTLAPQTDCDDVLVSVVGMAGLMGVMAAFEKGRRVLLANKEALVAGGQLVTAAAAKAGEDALLPVDSEHSAVFQCLQAAGDNEVDAIYLTCSGGPFRDWDQRRILAATREQALRHPTWAMGQKITVDSATLFNKALEIIEAKWLFHVEHRKIDVVIHPQSVIHSAIRFLDGAVLAQLGTPDMRLPILYAMSYPRRLPTGGEKLDLLSIGTLTFEQPDPGRFPSLRMAREALDAGGAAACVLNAANEEAVSEFLRSKNSIPLGKIFEVVEDCLARVGHLPAASLADVLYADRRARETAASLLGFHNKSVPSCVL
ncbi:MAG: 1-deoxy-D-xylulose-5-phosphate reductoisomerase [Clostridia bacterium]|nr:1-deoxy-D-xylulose-5-phosphate reductoisomerase [Clostridia bacterium]